MSKKIGSLQEAVDQQVELMEAMGIFDELVNEPKVTTSKVALGLVEEALEVFKETNKYRPWDDIVDNDELIDELADVLHYVLELFVILDFDAQTILNVYGRKNRRNLRRVQSGLKEIK